MGNKVVYAWYSSAKISFDGIEYLDQNSTLAKTYRGLKEVRNWIKL